MNEIVTLLNLTLFIRNFSTWLTVMFCLFVNGLYEWNVTKTNCYVHLNVTGKKHPWEAEDCDAVSV